MKPSQSFKNPYERMYGKSLTAEQVAEMRFNLVRYLELLIVLDRQHQEWLEERAHAKTQENEDESQPL